MVAVFFSLLGIFFGLSAVAAKNVLKPIEIKKGNPVYQLRQVASGFEEPTDLQFFPDKPDTLVVLEKTGKAKWVDLKTGKSGTILKLDVLTRSEQGLLGWAFDPGFAENKKVYTHYSTRAARGGLRKNISRFSEWKLVGKEAQEERILLEVVQPFVNHNGGQIRFGPDGYLYIALGDGGSGGDPFNHGQNTDTLLGSILRIDPSRSEAGRPYANPKGNPFLNRVKHRPEIWAYGLRNPWKFTFGPKGRLITGDVGQYLWEEITFVKKGRNHGWRIKEATHCFASQRECRQKTDLVEPFFEYDREKGHSVTGGEVYTGRRIPDLKGRYVFGDFVSGRIWSIVLPARPKEETRGDAVELGRWDIAISTFGKNARGEIFLADFNEGGVYRLEAVDTSAQPGEN